MKKIICIGICFLIWLNGFSQTYPIVYRSNSSLTVQDARFSAGLNFFVPRYNDTTAANLQLGNDSLGAVIFTYNTMTLWVRSHNGVKYWLEVGSGSGGGFTNPMTDEGDLIIGGVGGVAGRLAIGANAYVLTSDGTNFDWQPSVGGTTIYTGDDTLLGSRIIYGNGNDLSFENIPNFSVTDGVVNRIFTSATQTTIVSPSSSSYVMVSNASVDINGSMYALSLGGNGVGFVGVNNDGLLSWSSGGAGSVTSVSGVSNRTTITGTPTVNPTVDIAATYVGQTSITTLGTIATGTWSATAIAATRGGTGQTVYVVGDILTANTTTTLTRIAASTIGYVLMSNGAGVAPSWQILPSQNLIVQSAGGGEPIWYTSGDTLYLKSINGATTDTDSSLVVSGGISDGDKGDITVSGSGATWTVDNDVVTFAKFQNITQARLLGRYTASTGDMQEITLGSGLTLNSTTGELTASGGGGGITIGTTTITSGTNTRILYNNSGVVGEYTVTGTGTVAVLSTSPDFTTGITIGSVAVPTISSTNTLTNKRITARYGSTTSSATPTINTDNVDTYELTAQAADITSFTTNLTGTPAIDDVLHIIITGTAARLITWGASFEGSTITLPNTTVTTNRLDVFFVWTAAGKWRCSGAY